MKLMVFDVGGTDIKYSVMDDGARPRLSGKRPTCLDSQESFLAELEEIFQEVGKDAQGIAMSLPGIIDSKAGYCYTGGKLVFNCDTNLSELLRRRCGVPVHIENDGKCAAIAEQKAGSLRGVKDGAVFILGTGVGGGLILNGQLHRGNWFSAGEFSFLNTNSSAWEDRKSTTARQCSAGGLVRLVKDACQVQEPDFNGKTAFMLINAGDPRALDALKQYTRQIGIVLYNLEVLLNLERVAIGGGISREPKLLESLRESVDTLWATHPFSSYKTVFHKPEILPCLFGPEANQIGALYHFLELENG